MAISRARKKEFLEQYKQYLEQSQGAILVTFQGLTVPEMEDLRKRLREQGATFMVVKNTLLRIALEETGYPLPEGPVLEGPTAVVFTLEDPVSAAKTVVDFIKDHEEQLSIKAGYIERRAITADEVKQLAKLPPLPVLRAQLIGLLMAPATKLAQVLYAPARQVATVIKAYSEQGGQGESQAA